MVDKDENNQKNKINYIGFNYDSSYFCVGTDIGFQIYQTNPYGLILSKILNGGIGIINILDKSNLFILVGGGKNPRFSPNKLILWNDKKDEIYNEYRCDCFIINCYIKQNIIFIICSDNIILLKMKNLELFDIINTINNPKGIFCVCNEPKKNILAFPDNNKGDIIIKFFDDIQKENKENNGKNKDKDNNCNKEDKNIQIIKKAHKGNINNLCFNFSGTKLASTSNRGTTIRIFNIESNTLIAEFKRGATDANIYSLCFSFNDDFLGLTSDHNSCHIFDLHNLKPKSKDSNKSNVISYISGMGKYLTNNPNTYSFRHFEISKKVRSIISFSKEENNKCFIIDKGGNFLLVNFTEEEPKITKQKII